MSVEAIEDELRGLIGQRDLMACDLARLDGEITKAIRRYADAHKMLIRPRPDKVREALGLPSSHAAISAQIRGVSECPITK